MHPSTTHTTSEIPLTSSGFVRGGSNPNLAMNQHVSAQSLARSNSNYHFSYPDLASASAASLNYIDLLRTLNYQRFFGPTVTNDQLSDNSPTDYHPRNGSFHQYCPRLLPKPSQQQIDDEIFLNKFHHETLVNLDSGEPKNIQQLTTNDFLTSAKRNQQYSSILARVEHIGAIDKTTGKTELRFSIDEIDKTITYQVQPEMPFFVHQHSCWSSISPEHTYHRCGLKCRQLECGDIIIAVTEQQKVLPTKASDKPDYSQLSPTKCLVGRYINGQMSASATATSNKRHKISNE
ncbi:unnamed protein product [Adineta ricciae]|uniref:AXH domain-containing protein n=2 Tax=Adineta ricciae TaxID=249248 RepID=A0A814H6J3_ADIRI|nr:unnamed protein product [Adineta ricciae]